MLYVESVAFHKWTKRDNRNKLSTVDEEFTGVVHTVYDTSSNKSRLVNVTCIRVQELHFYDIATQGMCYCQ